ncbi:MAG: glycosyltransferase [Hydrogenibacillus schlegelii]|uniref:Glycosyltransferase n=1 Tax=Hydrogenibacillus schlegelii TaxID=1484 RepID=A0A2T5GBU3_HYDSH|nr:glycosyltransferase [Hydrogenibacillus schlegelii]PTQ53636.1 MAG: glycosyltransferase [Hydrogenibacillus schlegelii]
MPKRPRVLHVIGGGEFGGAERHLIALYRTLREDVDFTLATFYPGRLVEAFRELGAEPVILAQSGRFDLTLYRRVHALIVALKPDVVHSHGVRANLFARLAAARAGVPRIVTTVHSFLRYDYPLRREFVLAWAMEHASRPFVDHVIAVSDALRRSLEADGMAPERITVIENGVDLAPFAAARRTLRAPGQKKAFRSPLSLPEDAFVWAVTARLVPVKGLDVLLDAFARLIGDPTAPAGRSAYLLVIGTGPLKSSLSAAAERRGLAGRIRWLGHRDDVPELLAAADAFVLPSRQEGGFPLALVEALAAGLPAVATAVPAIAGTLAGAGDPPPVELVPPGDAEALAGAMRRLMAASPEVRTVRSASALRLVGERFSLSAFGRRHRAFYERLLASETT